MFQERVMIDILATMRVPKGALVDMTIDQWNLVSEPYRAVLCAL